MNKNEESLIKHALKLYGVQYTDNIYSNNYKSKNYIEVVDRSLEYSHMLRVYRGMIYMSYEVNRNTSLNLDNNIRSFINHWLRCYRVNEQINRVAVCKCSRNTFDVAILCNDNCWHYVLSTAYSSVEDWISYNW